MVKVGEADARAAYDVLRPLSNQAAALPADWKMLDGADKEAIIFLLLKEVLQRINAYGMVVQVLVTASATPPSSITPSTMVPRISSDRTLTKIPLLSSSGAEEAKVWPPASLASEAYPSSLLPRPG